MIHFKPWVPAALAALLLLGTDADRLAEAQNFAYQADIGFTSLQAELGVSMPTGAGQLITQIEAPLDSSPPFQTYFPNTTLSDFTGKTIIARSYTPTSTSGHATTVAQLLYGNTDSMTPGINNVDVYEANDWLGSGFLQAGSSSATDAPSTAMYNRVYNASWIGIDSLPADDAGNADILRRVDYLVQHDDALMVTAIAEVGIAGVNGPQSLMADSYNAITVGYTSESITYTGTVDLGDGFYTAGRAAPDLVANQDATSWATPVVASATALLVQVGHSSPTLSLNHSHTSPRTGFTIYDAETPDVIKAALMAGADRWTTNPVSGYGTITDYRATPADRTTNGLDFRFGAGQVDIDNSYHIIAAGEQHPGTISTFGFDYNSAFARTAIAEYTFTGDSSAAITLAWEAHIAAGANFTTSTGSLANFDLSLYDLSIGSVLVASSTSIIDNTQNLFLSDLNPADTYQIQVSRSDHLGTWDYGLAWDLAAISAPGPTSFYFDLNGSTAGSGASGQSAIWNTTATNWNTTADGGGNTTPWVNSTSASAAVFSAGNDATGAYSVSVSGTIQTNSITFNTGIVTIYGVNGSSPSLNIGSGGITINSTINGATTLDPSLGNLVVNASQSWLNNSSQPFNVNCAVAANGAYTLTLGGAGTGVNTINGIMGDGAGALTVTISAGSWVFTALNTYSGGTAITAGTLQTPRITNRLTIANGAKVVLTASGGTNPHASIIAGPGNLSIATAGVLDLTDNGLVITGATATTESTIASLIAGGQIISSVVSAHTGMAIAYDFASNVHLTFSGGNATWGGQSISQADASSDLLLLPTLAGDLNMVGAVNFTDVTMLAPNLGKTSGQTWASGDMNGDGAVNFTDVTALAPNLGKTVSSLSAPNFMVDPGTITASPEPGSLVLLALGGLLVLSRRRGA